MNKGLLCGLKIGVGYLVGVLIMFLTVNTNWVYGIWDIWGCIASLVFIGGVVWGFADL